MTDDDRDDSLEQRAARLRNMLEEHQSKTGQPTEEETRAARKRLRQADTKARMERAARTERRKRDEERRVVAARAKGELEAQERREAEERRLAEERIAERARRAELAAKQAEERRQAERQRAEREAAEQAQAEAETIEAERQREQIDTARRLYQVEQQMLTIKWVAGIIALLVVLVLWLEVISPAIYGECGEYGYKDRDTGECVGADIDYDPPGPVGP